MKQSSGSDKRVLIVGLGVAGMAAAIRLHEAGWETVIVERSVARRSGGYFVLVYGAGVAAAERLGIGDAVPTLQYEDQKTNEVLGSGRRMPDWVSRPWPARPG